MPDATRVAVRLSAPTGDARADRWRAHRATVRAELIEATLQAIEEFGPDLSIDDVVKTAGVPRPKLYRFFSDKETLFAAVGERAQELVLERVIPRFRLTATALELVRSALAGYIDLVDERPNLFRFLVGSHFSDDHSRTKLLEGGRNLSTATTDVLVAMLSAHGADADHLEYTADAILGAVALGVLRWLNEPTISKDELIAQLTPVIWGAVSAAAAARGIAIAPDEQMALFGTTD
ncbi:TetR/AcrR family transcriptional regulator [Mycobacterium sp. CBMA293]|uniref:TetR/AcrR family transcriptional regulator n=1 Tax=unclassified Mycolicibacterium TaxID=2636767 RepID=UPI0012DC8688|nr:MULTISPECIES: TetR/AcrR family transcriptional regulator [unclassified Mycolicibacterium]MUL48703.1 TetR/AcrR family transcriptional regulator [Mycolicibacterium sp. CBMA 360]MUL60799.1 TetR/AcrR family transcriptional regulator [Mycolicibacterium sp. CBMA 335]MUL71812.1 TetR/AcrR family transcriptional regulator [Mycolicibacterium sp. CBMA 311]MUL95740.1 TetR/AcrR family transcriptional regulator [Mycolicibacterium sp. CBMA 230]MUM03518.1 TetR family transcriptional regulator [Mycolicibact